jgi:prepilin-type processing-associated H-X9-DG protein
VATGARRRESGNRARGVAHLPRANPCAVSDWTGVKEILCALDVTVGLCFDGTVKAVGNRNYGQCNTEGWRDVVSVATSGRHTAALFADGHVEAIGLNESGECRTEEWERIIQIAVLPEVTLGLRADGRVLAAGRCSETLSRLDTVRAMACFGLRRQVFVTYNGEVYIHTRGSDLPPERLNGLKVMDPTVTDSILTRHTRGTLPAVAARALKGSFAVGMGHTLYVGEKGTLVASGANDGGQCDILTYRTAVSVSAGHYHSAAVLPDGRAVLSGRGSEGQCDARSLHLELSAVELTAEGNRSAAESPDAPLIHAWRRVVCGYTHTAALRSDGRVYAVGNNIDGRCDTRKWRNTVDLACGIRHTVACSADGTCVAVGDDRYGQCRVSDWRDIVMVAAGEFHTVGLTADGHVVAAGDNRKGQCDLSDLAEVVSVACLPEATLCVLADGSVTIRGGSGELNGEITALRDIVALNTCQHRVVAVTADRRLLTLPKPQAT